MDEAESPVVVGQVPDQLVGGIGYWSGQLELLTQPLRRRDMAGVGDRLPASPDPVVNRGLVSAAEDPACAGRTPAPARPDAPSSEDPRLRGEDYKAGEELQPCHGRPPPARGGLRPELQPDRRLGKTPACAGRTENGLALPVELGEDPRLRGEDNLPGEQQQTQRGRPPPARGGPTQVDRCPDRQRKTPACAGRTSTPRTPSSTTTEDPRLRGEDPYQTSGSIRRPGRPPPARGGPPRLVRVRLEHRKTPACAGRTR